MDRGGAEAGRVVKGNGKRIATLGDRMFCTVEQAEQLAHSAYLLARKEVAEEMQKMAQAFEARIKELDAKNVGSVDSERSGS